MALFIGFLANLIEFSRLFGVRDRPERLGKNSAPIMGTLKPSDFKMLRVSAARFGVIGISIALFVFLGACSRKVDTETQKPMVFFAPDNVTTVPDAYKPLYLGNLPPDRLAAFRAGLPYDGISLSRTTNADTSPIYRVTFHRSGEAELDVFQPKKSQAVGLIDLPTYARLCYALDTGGFKNYQNQYRANPLDYSACMVTIAMGKNQKTVTNYANIGPIQLWTTEQLIDGIRGRTEWKPVGK